MRDMFFSLFETRSTTFRKGQFFAFILGFAVRLIPEVVSYPYPIGFDTVYYAWRIKTDVVWYHWSQVFSTWLLYGVLVPVHNVVQGDPFLLLKLTAPLLFGLNAAGVYYFATNALSWTAKKGLFAALFFSLQIAALRISWDLFRNMLGLGVLLFALPWIKNRVKSLKEFAISILLSVLVVFSHEYGSVILLVAFSGVAISGFLKRTRMSILKDLTAISPALALFLAFIFFRVFPASPPFQRNVIWAYQPTGHYEGLFFITNYLTYSVAAQYPTYSDLASHVLSLFALLYLLILPLILVGFFRDEILDSWAVLLLVGAFGALISPFFAIDLWNRWMLLLVYPFTFYAVNGVTKVLHSSDQRVSSTFRWLKWMKLPKKLVKPILVLSFVLNLAFMITPLFFEKAGVLGFPTTVLYVPSTMQSNSLPLVDVDDAIRALQWLSSQMDGASVLLAQDAFFWWANLYLDSERAILYFKDDVMGAVDVAREYGFGRLYFVWWNEYNGWYGIIVPKYFVSIFNSDRISVFEYSR